MTSGLGRLEDLPAEYVRTLHERNLSPLWPALRTFIPHDRPTRKTQPYVWRYAEVRPLLMRAGELTPIEKAERRVLVLCNPGHGLKELRATPSIYAGLQLILPGETAANHRHTPSAVRFVIEGRGAYTVVGGEKLPMERGDLILTPSGLWHEHGHDGIEPVVWLDALDLPLHVLLETSCAIEGPSQRITGELGASHVRFQQGGIIPYSALMRAPASYPLMRFPWHDVKATLEAMSGSSAPGELAHVAYVNPETGKECLPTLGFSAVRLSPGTPAALPRHSASMILHVVEGEGIAQIDAERLNFSEFDTLAVPNFADVRLEATGSQPAYVFIIDDAPLQRRLGFYAVLDARPVE
jgi:gentisate 1,2-dioxygenase